MLWLVIGGILEISGLFSNTAGHGSQSLQVIIAPIFLAASIYISFGKLLKRLGVTNVSPMNVSLQSALFIIGDVVAFGLQIAGIVVQMMDVNRTVGTIMIIIGFVVQLISFSCFLALVISAHRKMDSRVRYISQGKFSWPNYIKVLYVVITLFFIRNIFRLVEYAEGWGGYIFTHAAFVYAFDCSTMVISMALIAIFHPQFVLNNISLEDPNENPFQDLRKG